MFDRSKVTLDTDHNVCAGVLRSLRGQRCRFLCQNHQTVQSVASVTGVGEFKGVEIFRLNLACGCGREVVLGSEKATPTPAAFAAAD
jgi:hypothetical protein